MNLSGLLLKCMDCIFPPSGESLRVRHALPQEVQDQYIVRVIDDIYTLSSFHHFLIRALVHEAKFHGSTKAFRLLNILFTEYLSHYTPRADMIIPIPLSPARMRTRGYNQVYEILRAEERQLTIPIETKILRRIRNTRPQTELGRTERVENMHDAFGVVHGEKLKGKHILLVDDVVTTGSTLRTAKASLLPYAPASVTMIALAH